MNVKITLILAICIGLFSCSVDNEEIIVPSPTADLETPGGGDPDPTFCTISTDLIAGQNILVGTVDVTYDSGNSTITVTYTTTGGWTLEESHLWVGECAERPSNNPGNPLIGQFPYSEEHTGETTYSYILDMTTENLDTIGCVAAHAVVNGSNGENETAWADGLAYGGNSWAMYFEYDFSTCN